VQENENEARTGITYESVRHGDYERVVKALEKFAFAERKREVGFLKVVRAFRTPAFAKNDMSTMMVFSSGDNSAVVENNSA
jgi:hypothetical protein